MSAVHKLITDHLDIWTAADTEKKSGRGRAAGSANSVYGIKKLRELILELAMRGKLVPQDPNDEPSLDFAKRVHPKFEVIKQNQAPFSLPSGWIWTKFSDFLDFQGGGQPPKDNFSDIELPGYVQLLQIRDLGENPQPIFIKKELSSKFCTTDDIMIGRYGASVGKIFWGKNGAYNVALVKVINEFNIFTKEFLFSFLKSPVGQSFFNGMSRSAQAGFNKSDIANKLIPIPPIAEQSRIVAKIDELMALCDQLEQQHNNAAEAHEQLVSHLLGTLTQSQDPDDFNANWQRIADHFDTLFTTESSIEALKQTILQLAVMGKLVRQDPNDEPASELLKRIRAEKAKVVAEGTVKKGKPIIPIGENEKPFDLPNGWAWARLEEIVEKSDSGWSPSCEAHPRSGTDWGVLKVSAVSWGKFLPGENKALPSALKARLDCVVGQGDFLISRANTSELVARSVVVEECPPNLMLSDKIVRLRLSSLCEKQFINLANTSPFAREYYLLNAGGTSSSMKNVTREQILNLAVGTPPLAEQRRIVTQTEELMNLCEQLKSRINAAIQVQRKLAITFTAETVE